MSQLLDYGSGNNSIEQNGQNSNDYGKEMSEGVKKQRRGKNDEIREQSDLRRFYSRRTNNKEAFNEWFNGSQVVDENGEPLVVYHGTASDLTE